MKTFTNSQVAAIIIAVGMLAIVIIVFWMRSLGIHVSSPIVAVAGFCAVVINTLCRSIVPQASGLVEEVTDTFPAPTATASAVEQKVADIIAALVPPAVTADVKDAINTMLRPTVADAKTSLTAHAESLKEQISETPLHVTAQFSAATLTEGHSAMAAQKAAADAIDAQNAAPALATATDSAATSADGSEATPLAMPPIGA